MADHHTVRIEIPEGLVEVDWSSSSRSYIPEIVVPEGADLATLVQTWCEDTWNGVDVSVPDEGEDGNMGQAAIETAFLAGLWLGARAQRGE